jgi:hypothetical protein
MLREACGHYPPSQISLPNQYFSDTSSDPERPAGILFTYDRFSGMEPMPQRGPLYTHSESCPRYAENAGFPEELRGTPRTLETYARGRRLVAQEYVADGKFEPAIEKLFAHSQVDYLLVNSTTAGCFTFRIDRGGS